MDRVPIETNDAFLTDRQAEVLELRHRGLTQREIADRLGTSTANISAIESAARTNVERARHTLYLARLLRSATRFTIPAGTDFRDVIDRVYEAGNDANLKVTYSDPELSSHLQTHLDPWLDGRTLTADVEVGITDDGGVVTYPSVVDPLSGGET